MSDSESQDMLGGSHGKPPPSRTTLARPNSYEFSLNWVEKCRAAGTRRGASSGPAPFPRKPPARSVIQQPVLRSPHHDLLLRGNAQFHLNGVDGVSKVDYS